MNKKEWKENYSKKLKDPRWQKKRLAIMERDKWECCHCGDRDNTLNVHHIKYTSGREPWDYESDSLITLCTTCHEAEFDCYKENLEELEKMLKDFYFTSSDLMSLLDFGGSIMRENGKTSLLDLIFHEATKKL